MAGNSVSGGTHTHERVEWSKLRTEFLSSLDLSLRRLARKHGVTHQAVQRRAKREGWLKQRAEIAQDVVAAVRRTAVTELSQLAQKNAQELLRGLSKVRRRVLSDLASDLDTGTATVEETVETVEVPGTARKGAKTTRTVRRRAAHGRTAREVLKQEVELVTRLTGHGGAADADRTVEVE